MVACCQLHPGRSDGASAHKIHILNILCCTPSPLKLRSPQKYACRDPRSLGSTQKLAMPSTVASTLPGIFASTRCNVYGQPHPEPTSSFANSLPSVPLLNPHNSSTEPRCAPPFTKHTRVTIKKLTFSLYSGKSVSG